MAGKLTFSDTFLQVNGSYQLPSEDLGIGQEQSFVNARFPVHQAVIWVQKA